MKRQRKMKVMKDMTKNIRGKERMDAENRWWLLSCWRHTERKLGSIQKRKKPCKNVLFCWRK